MELSPQETEKIAQHLPGLVQLTLSGGEPFLREDLIELISPIIARSQPAFVSIPTNATLPKKIADFTQILCEKFPQTIFTIELSIDGLGERHNQTRGIANGFELALKTYQELKTLRSKYSNLRIATITVLSPLNQGEIFPLLQYLRKLAPDRMEVNLLRGIPRDKNLSLVSLEKFQEVALWLEENLPPAKTLADRLRAEVSRQKRKMIIQALKEKKMPLPCQAGKKLMVLYPDGSVFPCEMKEELSKNLSEISLGNLREFNYDLSQLLKNPRAKSLLSQLEKAKCFCSYECAHLANLVFSPRTMLKIFLRASLRFS